MHLNMYISQNMYILKYTLENMKFYIQNINSY